MSATTTTTAAAQLKKLITDIETDLGIDANTPIGGEKKAAAVTPAAATEQKPKAAKKEKAAKPAKKAAPADADQAEITKLDIRVGKIVKVWKHDTADKYVSLLLLLLLCRYALWVHTLARLLP